MKRGLRINMDYDYIEKNLEEITDTLPSNVTLVAVTKTHGTEEINKAIDWGVTDIGENKVQEILEKYPHVKPVRWHLIGHLQTNKVKQIIDKVHLIHSVDSMKLAGEINKRAGQVGKTVNVLIQINSAGEESKFGIETEETEMMVKQILDECENIKICGLMCIAPFDEDPDNVREYFRVVKEQYDELAKIDHENLEFKYLSMGMSHDYRVAVSEGSNMVRIGSAIFGRRNY
ncbi:pyridoxal phosphate enzyme, YggS family [Eubacterium brachy ATCC 33089]|nr:pyridoxal phosphate enzyme, YggS family [Eubacterium brachy ATCC 33089]